MPINKLSLIGSLIFCASIILSNNCSVSAASFRVVRDRYVSYYETYRRQILWITRIKTRINYRIEHYVSWELTNVCCGGYEILDSLRKLQCIPRCESGCANGECIHPNECNCNVDYVSAINNITGWSECLPWCADNCLNGRCRAPNVCDCNPGFISADDRATCQPSCASIGREDSQGCGKNASCIGPNLCRCAAGYKVIRKAAIENSSTSLIMELSSIPISHSSTPQRTIPISSTEQPIAVTGDPIFNSDAFFCEPTCSESCSLDASCVAPDLCECNPGYSVEVLSHHLKNGSRKCYPVCHQKCVNAFCSNPNRCTCSEGYKSVKNDSFACEPICQVDCINAVCTLPNYCECINGYEKSSHLQHPKHICTPICSGGCLNGNCVAPDTCVCSEGYIFTYEESNDTKSLTCRPHCTPQCHSGSFCAAPGQCLLQIPLTDVDDNCNKNGILSEVNESCRCNYGWTGPKCNKPKYCGTFIALDNESNVRFLKAERVFNPGEWSWNGLHCNEECKYSLLLFKASENTSTDVIHCYHLELMEQAAGLVSYAVSLSEAFDANPTTIFCFLASDSSCNVTKSNSTSIIFGSLTLLLVIGCGIILYRLRDRLKRIAHRESPRVTDDLKEPLRITETLSRTRVDVF